MYFTKNHDLKNRKNKILRHRKIEDVSFKKFTKLDENGESFNSLAKSLEDKKRKTSRLKLHAIKKLKTWKDNQKTSILVFLMFLISLQLSFHISSKIKFNKFYNSFYSVNTRSAWSHRKKFQFIAF